MNAAHKITEILLEVKELLNLVWNSPNWIEPCLAFLHDCQHKRMHSDAALFLQQIAQYG
jgi:hypothetical protein